MTEKDVEKDTMRSVLASFCQWLENLGYLDDDWWCEEPKAVDRFLAENPRMEKIIKELRTRVAELTNHEEQTHKDLGEILGTDDSLKNCALRLQTRLSTLLKASEGMEKALEAHTECLIDCPMCKSLADFRALKETK